LIAGCTKLQRLNFTGLKKLTDEGLLKLLSSPTHLTLLNLEMCDFVNDELLVRIKQAHPSLTIYNYYKDEISP
jgi:hypothetical protein